MQLSTQCIRYYNFKANLQNETFQQLYSG